MKRFLSILLVLATLLCLFPFAVSAEGEGADTGDKSAATYLDLYVKDGLVALFDAYSATASETAVLSWTPVDLYGKAGYDDYLAPKEYFFAGSGTQESQFTWRYVDGALAPFVSNATVSTPTYLELSGEDGLSADILNGTVQEVFAPATVNRVKPTVTDGFLNSAELPAFGTECQAAFGAYSFGGMLRIRGNPAFEGDPGKMINLFSEFPTFNGASIGCLYYSGEKFGTMSYPSLKGYSPTNGNELTLDNYSIGMPIVVERTVIRTVENVDGTYTSTYGLHYAAVPTYVGQKVNSGTFPALVYTSSSDNAALHTKTTLRLAADTAPVYSIRVYNKALSAEEVARNHMADLVAFYGVSADKVLALSEETLLGFIELCAAYEMTPDGKSDEEGSAYMTVKGALEAYLDAGEERLEECVKQLLTFAGIRYRVTGQYGIRTIFAVDQEAVLYLEESGYTVVYGALMAVKEKGDTQYNASAEDITVRVGEDGKVELATGNAAVLVSSDNGLKYLTEDEDSFAFTTLYDPGHANDEDSIYDAKMLYRGFVAVIDGEGTARVLYDDLAMEDDALNAPSLREVHQYALDNTPDLPEELSNRLKFLDE